MEQVQMVSIEELLPTEHLLRKVEAAMDWDFIYPLVEISTARTADGQA